MTSEHTGGSTSSPTSDFFAEASDPTGEQLGLERVIEYARAHRAELAQNLAARTFARSQAQQDDMASVILKAA